MVSLPQIRSFVIDGVSNSPKGMGAEPARPPSDHVFVLGLLSVITETFACTTQFYCNV